MPFSAFNSSSSPGTLAHERRAEGELFIHSSAQFSLGFIPLCIRENCEFGGEMANYWLSCALAESKMPFAMTYYNQLQPTDHMPSIWHNHYDVMSFVIVLIKKTPSWP